MIDEFRERYEHGKHIIDNCPMGFRIRKLTKQTPEDLEAQCVAVAELADEIWHEHFIPIIGAPQVDYMVKKFQSAERIYASIKEEGYVYLTATSIEEDRLVGYCGAVPEEGRLFLSKLYVHRDFRGRGIARCFLDDLIAMCRQEYGLAVIRLTVNKYNESAIATHLRNGFTIVDSVTVDIGGGFFMDDYVMELSLSKF